MVLLGGRYLEMIVAEHIDDLDRRRRHRSLDRHPACGTNRKPTSVPTSMSSEVQRTNIVGGLIHEY